MDRSGNFIVGFLAGIVGLYLVMHYTLVRANDGFHIVPKIASKLERPYEDVREYRVQHWTRKQALALAILQSGKGYLLNDPNLSDFVEQQKSLLQRFRSSKSTDARVSSNRL